MRLPASDEFRRESTRLASADFSRRRRVASSASTPRTRGDLELRARRSSRARSGSMKRFEASRTGRRRCAAAISPTVLTSVEQRSRDSASPRLSAAAPCISYDGTLPGATRHLTCGRTATPPAGPPNSSPSARAGAAYSQTAHTSIFSRHTYSDYAITFCVNSFQQDACEPKSGTNQTK